MDDIKVSVCMTTYNQERYIAQAVESVLAQQTTFPIEIVIGEDCSTDGTRAILLDLARGNPEKIQLRLAERNQGGKANFMDVAKACRGQYVAMLEGDDYWTCPNKLQMQVEALDTHLEWAMCFHPTMCVYEGWMQGQDIYPLNWDRAEATLVDLLAANFIPTNSVVFRNRLFGAFPPWFRGLLLGDWPLHILNAAHGNIGYLPDVMSAYRIHPGGVWSGETPVARMAAIFKMFTAIDHHFAGKYANEIDCYRLKLTGELMAELDSTKSSYEELAKELARVNAKEWNRTSCEDVDNDTLQKYWNQLSGDFISLESEHEVLKVENQKLKAFHDAWSKSIVYRVARETRRPVNQLWHRMRRPFGGSTEPQLPTASSVSKVA